MPYELVMRLGQPFDALVGDKVVTLPADGEIRIQFAGKQEALAVYMHLSANTSVRPCRDESSGYRNQVVQGEVISEDKDPAGVMGALTRAAEGFAAGLDMDSSMAMSAYELRRQRYQEENDAGDQQQ